MKHSGVILLVLTTIVSVSLAAWPGEYEYTDTCDLRPFTESKCLQSSNSEACFTCLHNTIKGADCSTVESGAEPDCTKITECVKGLTYDCS